MFKNFGLDISLNRTSLIPPQIFDAHLLENADLSPSRFHFSVFEQMRFKRKKNDVKLTNLKSHHFI